MTIEQDQAIDLLDQAPPYARRPQSPAGTTGRPRLRAGESALGRALPRYRTGRKSKLHTGRRDCATSNQSPDNDQPQFRCNRAADLRKLTSRSSYCRFPPYLGCPPLRSAAGSRPSPGPGRHRTRGQAAMRPASDRRSDGICSDLSRLWPQGARQPNMPTRGSGVSSNEAQQDYCHRRYRCARGRPGARGSEPQLGGGIGYFG
jgi:hypothetical protein